MDGSNNVIDFQKMKDRKEAIEYIEKMFEHADTMEFSPDYTRIDQYDYKHLLVSKNDDDKDR